MMRATLLGTALLMTLSACAQVSESRFNPVNWFSGSREAPQIDQTEARPLVPEGGLTQTVDGRVLVQSVTALNVDRTPGGAIVRAVGIAPTQGYFNAELVSLGVANGVLTLDFRAQQPRGGQTQGSTQSREISAAFVIEPNELAGIRSVRVQGATNARTSGR